jgi:HrpA-like RNA helicase
MSLYGYRLPIEDWKDQILATMRRHRVTIVRGPTGCGKSTFIPCILSSPCKRIAVIEPRRIAVTSLYNTLSAVLENVGYKMRFSKNITRESRVIIYTDGSFLNEASFSEFDYIIVDEVHERSVRTDVLLGILKDNMHCIRSKIILMSATVDIEKIGRYFGAGTIEIPGEPHPVRIEYAAEDVSDYIVESYCTIKKIISKREECVDGAKVANRDVLVFLPGEEDINALHLLLRKIITVKVYKVFSALSDREQNRIYEECNIRKVVLSTNICETSLTIPGIGYVIDCGLHKTKIFDQVNFLGIQPISKDSAQQRLGRCNRTGPGVCYRLYTKEMYEGLPPATPEICRADLSQVFLQLLEYKRDILGFEFLDFPPRSNAVSGLKLLLDKGCAKLYDCEARKELSEDDCIALGSKAEEGGSMLENRVRVQITSYGRMISRLPFDVHLAHFYQQCLSNNVGYYGSILLSLISQENYNFLRNTQPEFRTDIEFLIDLFERYLEAEDRKGFCVRNEVSLKGMERGARIFKVLDKKKDGDLQLLERIFSYAYQHNLSERQEDGSYRHLGSGNVVWMHPRSYFFRRRDRFIVFVDVFFTSKMYARVVGKYYGE